MSEPLRFAFEVACPMDHAFATWTERIATWWPADHTVSGAPEAVVFERRVGGRIYERTPEGDEHLWGEVAAFDPPAHLAYHWHLGVGPELATEVGVTFHRARRLDDAGRGRTDGVRAPRRARGPTTGPATESDGSH